MTSIRRGKIILFWSLITLVLCAIQTTLWPHLFGSIAAPQLWINLILYFILFRSRRNALIITYALGILITAFSSLSLGVYWASFLILVPIAASIRERAFWPSSRDFALGSLGLTLGWQIISNIMTRLTDANIVNFFLFNKAIELALTPLTAFVLYPLFCWADRIFAVEMGPNISGATHE